MAYEAVGYAVRNLSCCCIKRRLLKVGKKGERDEKGREMGHCHYGGDLLGIMRKGRKGRDRSEK
jgi:hypothetical protein